MNIKNFIQRCYRFILRRINIFRPTRMKIYNCILNNGERFDPKLFGKIGSIDNNHLPRYRFAINYVNKNDDVLDIACGTGYGTEQLATHGKYATGVDMSQEAINYARKNYSHRNNVQFVLNDFFSNSILADIVVSFETVEHLERPLVEIFDKLLNFTKKILIASVPYKEKDGDNPHHKHFNIDEQSFAFLNDFGKVKFFYQDRLGHISDTKQQNNDGEIQNLILLFFKNN
ncbi:MAG: class I SAM-dependent methyltransferase [Candidatus Magasanikbacteria bacterium]|nr:class I SAM-dependent methyltransferase [Candidatus Magasanikbacteria bacterium]